MYTKNNDYFDRSQLTTEACYWAGFIAADGFIKTDNVLSIKLSRKDKSHLELFAKHLSYTGTVKDYEEMSNFPQDKSIHKKCYSSTLSICSAQKIIKDLYYIFNIIPHKSLTLLPPNIKNIKYKLAYIKGYIDGDGCITFYSDKRRPNYLRLEVTILGTKELLQWIKNIFDNIYKNKGTSANIRHKPNSKTYVYKIGANKAQKILTLINKSTKLGLQRKWNILDTYILKQKRVRLSLTHKQIIKIQKQLKKKTLPQYIIAKHFKVSPTTISRIKHMV